MLTKFNIYGFLAANGITTSESGFEIQYGLTISDFEEIILAFYQKIDSLNPYFKLNSRTLEANEITAIIKKSAQIGRKAALSCINSMSLVNYPVKWYICCFLDIPVKN